MKNIAKLILIALLIFLNKCSWELPSSPDLTIDFNEIDPNTIDLYLIEKIVMDGKYLVREGNHLLGDSLAGKWIGNRWCMYSNIDVIYSESAGGIVGEDIKLTEYFRLVRSGSGFKVNFIIKSEDGAKEIISGLTPKKIILKGTTKSGLKIILEKVDEINSKELLVIAHRGGGRNSERLGFSENSIELMLHSQILGASGIEIDVRRTRDGQIIVFHDETFSPRTVKGVYLLGKVSNFDLSHIEKFGRLIHGKKIPTLREALKVVIEKTNLSLVWLDIKEPECIDSVILIQKEANEYAKSKNRDILILLGIPSKELLSAYLSSKFAHTTPILFELDFETAMNLPTCLVWAPRWTRNVSNEEILIAHSKGKLVFTWTLDQKEIIDDFLYQKKFDGILTNYPSLVYGIHLCKRY